jgi:hypothetical protein
MEKMMERKKKGKKGSLKHRAAYKRNHVKMRLAGAHVVVRSARVGRLRDLVTKQEARALKNAELSLDYVLKTWASMGEYWADKIQEHGTNIPEREEFVRRLEK